MAMQQGVCEHCDELKEGLDRLNSNGLLELMREYRNTYTRQSRFCVTCKKRAIAKFQHRKRVQRKKALISSQPTSDDKTTSYSAPSNHAALSVTSSSNTSGQSSTNKRRHDEEARPSRNVAKRTRGPPKNQSVTSTSSSQTSRQDPLPIFNTTDVPSTQTSDDDDGNSRTSRSHSPVAPNIDYDDSADDLNAQTDNGNGSGDSMQIAPMPHNREQRTRELTRPPTPERMRELSSQERSMDFRRYNRGGGG